MVLQASEIFTFSQLAAGILLIVSNQHIHNPYHGFHYYRQLSMSEKLAQLAHKIDFGKTQKEDEELTEDESDKPLFQPSLWPWDSVRNKLRLRMGQFF